MPRCQWGEPDKFWSQENGTLVLPLLPLDGANASLTSERDFVGPSFGGVGLLYAAVLLIHP